jgi:hypothetical protein
VDARHKAGHDGAEMAHNMSTGMKFRVELVWKDDSGGDDASSIYLTSDGRVILQGKGISAEQRKQLLLPEDGDMISIDKTLIRAIKEML